MAEWKKVIVSGSSPEFAAITVDGTVTANAFSGDGSGLTGVAAGSIDIDNFSAGTVLDQADVFLYSDGGTEKKITFSNIEDEIFGNVSGDATIAAGGALTIAAGAVENSMLAGSITNAKLSNSAITIAGNSTSLGGSITQAAILDGSTVISSSMSVTKLSDVSSAGSGQIITSGERTKLSGIETGADVTDATNVQAAGALMDSEVTNLAQVKAFDSSDYATAGQGSKADSAQQPPSEGAFVDGDKTKLDGIESGADVTDTANVTAAGALMDTEVDADIKTLSLPANTTISSFGKTLVDDANAAAARTTLGLGSIATLSSIDISSNTNLTAGTGVTLTGDTLSIGQDVATNANVTFANITATGDLTVQGTLTSLQTTNLNVEDQLILLGSGSADARDLGLVFGGSNGTAGRGDAFFYDMDTDRPAWSSGDVSWDDTEVTPTAFIPRVYDVDGSSHIPVAEVGSIQVSGGEVFIYG